MDSRLILIVIGVTFAVFGRSEAIRCYVCPTVTQSNCLDPFKSEGVTTCNATACLKVTSSGGGVTSVVRSCYPTTAESDKCDKVSVGGASTTTCYCSTDLCNGGQVVKPTLYNVVIGAGMAAVSMIATMKQI